MGSPPLGHPICMACVWESGVRQLQLSMGASGLQLKSPAGFLDRGLDVLAPVRKRMLIPYTEMDRVFNVPMVPPRPAVTLPYTYAPDLWQCDQPMR